MRDIIYNPRYEKYKKPFGAVKTCETVIFSIDVNNSLSPDEVYFIYRADESNESIYIYMDKTESYDDYSVFSCKINFNKANLYFYRFEIKTGGITKFIGKNGNEAKIEDWLPEWQLTVFDKNFDTPEWTHGATMYQIFPDRFAKSDKFNPQTAKNERKIHKDWFELPEFIYDTIDYKANDYFGGNIQGVIEKLDYLVDLGIDIIYFNPVFESPEYHRYSTGNYLNIDPYFGTNEDFKLLCEECKKRNIKIIIDGVFSHTGADSLYFNKYNHYDSVGAANSCTSPYYNWYSFIEYPNKYHSWWGFDNLPNVDENNPEYTNFITGKDGVIDYWQNMGCSGWRLDVADELPDEFISALYKRSKENNKESFIIGEVWEDATNKFAYGKRRKYLLGGQMDSVMNYPFRTAILEFIKEKDHILFNDRIYSILENYPPPVVKSLMNSISTHDTIRAISYFGVSVNVDKKDHGKYILSQEEYNKGKKQLLFATFLQFTLPGIPSVYYGDEVGLDGLSDPYCRKTYPYGKEDFEILSFYKELSKIRKNNKEDFSSNFSHIESDYGFYVYKRGNLICGINLSNEDKFLKLENEEIIYSFGDIKQENDTLKINSESMFIVKRQ